MSLNKVMLNGNVGKDPEVRYLETNPVPQGNAPKVASFPLATSERYKDRNGNLQENTEWHNIVAWRGLADTVERFVRKGTQLYIEGKIRTRSWTDQAGTKKYSTEIIADTIQLLGKRADNPGAAPGTGYPQNSGYPQQGYQQAGGYQQNAPQQYQPGSPYSQPAPQAGTPYSQPAPAPEYPAAGPEMDDLPF